MPSATVDYPHLLSQKKPAPIHKASEHKERLAELQTLLSKTDLTSPEKTYCELLALLVEDYEKKTFALPNLSPIDLLKELMEANNLQQKDLLPIFKHKTLISEILNGKRRLSVEHIRGLAKRFHIPAEAFI